jgi:hypothetical protein
MALPLPIVFTSCLPFIIIEQCQPHRLLAPPNYAPANLTIPIFFFFIIAYCADTANYWSYTATPLDTQR